MSVDSSRLIPFSDEDIPNRDGAGNDPDDDAEVLDAAQDAGIALKMMRDDAKRSLGEMAELLRVSEEYLQHAEAGELVEFTTDGRLIDISASLLIRVARVTGRQSIPVPSAVRY